MYTVYGCLATWYATWDASFFIHVHTHTRLVVNEKIAMPINVHTQHISIISISLELKFGRILKSDRFNRIFWLRCFVDDDDGFLFLCLFSRFHLSHLSLFDLYQCECLCMLCVPHAILFFKFIWGHVHQEMAKKKEKKNNQIHTQIRRSVCHSSVRETSLKSMRDINKQLLIAFEREKMHGNFDKIWYSTYYNII